MTKMEHAHPTALQSLAVCMALLLMPVGAFAQYSAFEDPVSPNSAGGAATGSFEFGPAKAEVEGGDIPVGQSAQVIVMMRNNTSAQVTLQKIELVPSSNVTATVANDQCSKAPVKPGIECPVTISVKAEAAGKYRVGMLINHDARSKITNAAIVGNTMGSGSGASGMPVSELEAYPNIVDFQQAKGRAPLVRSITLRNSSTKAITINGIELVASPLTGFSVSAPECKDLLPSQSCVATVTWTPSVTGNSEGVLVLRHDGPSGSLQIPLKGSFEITPTTKAETFPSLVPGQGLIVADRETVDFGTAIDGAASITVSLVNAGDKEVTLNQVKLAGSDNGLSLSSDDCKTGKVLKANQGCALTVNWLPRRKGPVIDDVQIIHDGARGVLILPVRGTATETVNLNLPISSRSIPKMESNDLDEAMLSKEEKASRAASSATKHGVASTSSTSAYPTGMAGLGTDISSLNGYRVTSLSAKRAVITGNNSRIVVEDGRPQAIAGNRWIPSISEDGVELIGDTDSVFLLFDRSLNLSGSSSRGTSTFPTSSAPATAAPATSTSSTTASTTGGVSTTPQ